MGFITRNTDRSKICLKASHHIGRAHFNDTIINASDISRSHASIYWENGHWYLKDTSKNGTLVNGKKYFQSTTKLKRGSILQFGVDSQSVWELSGDDQPSSYLMTTDGSQYLKLSDQQVYPDDKAPLVSFFRIKNDEWKIDTGIAIDTLVEGERYSLADTSWMFVKNDVLDETIETNIEFNEVQLDFSLSPDEEEVSLKIRINDHCIDMGRKVYNHLILFLAREKNKGVEWVQMDEVKEKLKKELLNSSLDEYYVNVQIHRLRKQLMNSKPFGPFISDLIMRKNGFLGLRFDHININKTSFA